MTTTHTSATEDLTTLSADEIARRTRAGALSAREVVETYLRRIEELNPRLNAVVVRRFEEALREAEAADASRARGRRE
jgi:Asp-tRNA(Asn)/Glu-tRNA(Gln) amidotransferase A subunit family amidase